LKILVKKILLQLHKINSEFDESSDEEENEGSDDESETFTITTRKFVICTGAGPSIPSTLKESAKKVNLEVLTYRSIFRPDGEGIKSDILWNMKLSKDQKRKVVIVGGGPSACEIAQSLARLNKSLEITIIAPYILGTEDIAARVAARNILNRDGVNIINHRRVIKASNFGTTKVLNLDDKTQVPVEVLICATGRDPGQNLVDMQLEKAGVKWDYKDGIIVNSKLQSVSSRNVFAAGDCASAVPNTDRRAAHAGWTGYHAVQSAIFPRFLIPSESIHPLVPRVTFLNPEIASIGMTRADCVQSFGVDGFKYLIVAENNTDRADIDSIERSADGFVELRISISRGRILGATVCSPAASEIVNELGVAMMNKLTCRDIAKCIHVYPSYGYLMHRVALSLAMNDVWGILAACGPFGKSAGFIGRNVQAFFRKEFFLRKNKKYLHNWEAAGTQNELNYHVPGNVHWIKTVNGMSFLEASNDADFCEIVRSYVGEDNVRLPEKEILKHFIKWLDSKPQ